MEPIYVKLIECAAVVMAYALLRIVLNLVINKTMKEKLFDKSRGDFTKKLLNFALLAVCFVFICLVWGVKESQLLVLTGSVFTVIGVALFAQWSILSNVTSGIIIFFNHPVRLGDTVVIMEAKDYEIEGEVIKIGVFFVTILNKPGGGRPTEEITLPNNIFIQKILRKKLEATPEDEGDGA